MFDLSISEDYYKPITVNIASDNNYIQYESKGVKILTIKEYLSMIELYLVDMINDYKDKGEWMIQLTAEINFSSLKPDSNETHTMYTKSDNIEIMIGSKTNEVIEDLFKSILERYQENLEEKMRGSEFSFGGVNVSYYDFNKTSLNRGGSQIESNKRISAKKATINPKNKKDNKCFQYALTVALNHEKSKTTQKEYQKLNLLLINTIGMI